MARSSAALLKCYDCIGTDCLDEKLCSDSDDACVKNFVGGVTISKGCGLASSANNCDAGITGICTCTADLCNAAVRGMAASALTLFGLAAASIYYFV